MTLLITEIHVQGNLSKSVICFAADRRITEQGKNPRNMKKIFRIPKLKAGIGFYGIAELESKEDMSNWLANFVNNSSTSSSIEDFAHKLRSELNQRVSKSLLKRMPSGFQICGYNANHLPELWHICNHDMRGNDYTNFVMSYKQPSEDFLRRDANKLTKLTGTHVPNLGRQYYINGDVRPFHAGWQRLDSFLGEMLSQTGFRQPRDFNDYLELTKWKMKLIASFYQKFAIKPIIGGPIDGFVVDI